ncbi:helix-turn-helix transcriptional regulator [Roseovarius sp. EL26]|uniref:helix-turn-helix transcriptional regulator n=1 Tax=Roseovarius sp. EL26 TaxID=2126672 RepID=UPI0013C486CC|nr:helix-turn-helix transcriptional regulator [Roseovarius sp. EL26]
MTDETTSKALGDTINALGTSDFAPALYHWLQGNCAIDNITIIAFFQDRKPEVFFSHTNVRRVFERLESEYVRGAYLLDPAHALHLNDANEDLYRYKDIAPDHFQRTEFFAAYYGRTTLVDELIYFVQPADGVSVTICIGRDASSKRKFSTKAIAQARALAPIVTALSKQQWHDLQSTKTTSSEPVPETLRERLVAEKDIALSPRQSEIAFMILKGHSSVSIGLTLGISPQTVKVIRKQLYKKCMISSQAELFSLLTPYLLGK